MANYGIKKWLSDSTTNGASIQATVNDKKAYVLRISDCNRTIRISGNKEDIGKLFILRDSLTDLIKAVQDEKSN